MARLSTSCFGLAIVVGGLVATSQAAAQDTNVIQQDVSVDLSHPDDLRIQLELVTEATAVTDQLWMPRPLLPNVTATVDGVVVVPSPHPSYPNEILRVPFPTTLAAGEQVTISMVLSGAPSCGGGAAWCFHSPSETIFTSPQPGSAWYHSDLLKSDTFVGSVEVLAPSSFVVVAGQGAPSSTTPQGVNVRWRFDIDHATELLGLYAGEADTITSSDASVPITALYHADRDDEQDVATAVEVATQVWAIFTETYGVVPVDRVNLITTPASFAAGGLGMMGKVFFNAVVFGNYDYLVVQGTAHELAHSWWGNLASGFALNERAFLGEGMAEYAAWRALGSWQGDDVRTAGMRMNAVWYQYARPMDVDVPILAANVTSSPAYVHVTYHKGALVMRALEAIVGAEPFGRALRRFVARGYAQLSVQGLIDDVLTETDYDATEFVNQWLRATGFPYVFVTPTPTDGGLDLTVEVVGNFNALSLPVRLTMTNGDTLDETITVSAGVSQHAFSFADELAGVVIDGAWSMPREVVATRSSDVNHDGAVDAADLIEVGLRLGTGLPSARRVDGGYDPLFDIDRDRTVGPLDLEAVRSAASL